MADGLAAAVELDWGDDDVTKLLVLCADAPPHRICDSRGDSLPNGCPDGFDCVRAAQLLASMGIIIYTVGVRTAERRTVATLCAFSRMTGGRYVPLDDAAALPIVLVGSAEEETAMKCFQHELLKARDVVLAQRRHEQLPDDDEAVCEAVATLLQRRGVCIPSANIGLAPGAAWERMIDQLALARDEVQFNEIAASPGVAELLSDALVQKRMEQQKRRRAEAELLRRHFDRVDLPMQFGRLPPKVFRIKYMQTADSTEDVDEDLEMPRAGGDKTVVYDMNPITVEQVRRALFRNAKWNEMQ